MSAEIIFINLLGELLYPPISRAVNEHLHLARSIPRQPKQGSLKHGQHHQNCFAVASRLSAMNGSLRFRKSLQVAQSGEQVSDIFHRRRPRQRSINQLSVLCYSAGFSLYEVIRSPFIFWHACRPRKNKWQDKLSASMPNPLIYSRPHTVTLRVAVNASVTPC